MYCTHSIRTPSLPLALAYMFLGYIGRSFVIGYVLATARDVFHAKCLECPDRVCTSERSMVSSSWRPPRANPFRVRYPRNQPLHAHDLCSRETTLLDIGDPSRPFGHPEPPD